MSGERPRWFATGNHAVGFVAMGNIATGVFAFGNVARGVFAFGNLAVGVVAVGNVGFGIVFGGGATVAAGFLAYAGCLGFPVVAGGSAIDGFESCWLAGLVPVLAWALVSFVKRGRREPRPPRPRLVRPAALLEGKVAAGFVDAVLEGASAGRLALRHGRLVLEAEAGPEIVDRAASLAFDGEGPVPVHAYLEVSESPAAGGAYRAPPELARSLRCVALRLRPPSPVPWASADELQYWLSWAFRGGAALGAAFLVGRFVAWAFVP